MRFSNENSNRREEEGDRNEAREAAAAAAEFVGLMEKADESDGVKHDRSTFAATGMGLLGLRG